MVLPWLAAAWIAGLAADPVVPFSLWQWATLAFVAVAAAWATRREPRLGWSFLALAVAFLGALRASTAGLQRDQSNLAAYARTSEPVDVFGSVVASPTRWGDKYTFDLRAEGILGAGESRSGEAEGLVRVISATSLPATRAETVVVHGRLRPARPFEGPRSSAVLEAASIRQLAPPPRLHPMVLLDGLRGHMVDRLYQALPDEEASLVAGVLLGADEGMPDRLQEAFRVTGTAHVLAVSGFNVTVVAAAAAAGFGALLGARRGALSAGAAVTLYTLLCGAEASVVRAAIMACAALLAVRLGRQPAALTSLAAAAILMSLVDPPVIYDVGFQLSFLATLGLILAGRPAQEAIRRWGGRAVGKQGTRAAVVFVAEIAALSMIAQAATLPLSAYVFNRLPVTALPANVLILPVQPMLMAAGAVTAVVGLVSPALSTAISWLVWPLATYTIRVVELFASLPGASLSLPPIPGGWVVLGYAAAAGLIVAAKQSRARSAAASLLRVGGPAWLVVLAGLATLAWRTAIERPDGRLHMTAFPGGEVLIETPAGRFVAVSVGPTPIGLGESLDRRLPVTHPALDWLLLTDPESSVAATLQALGRHRPDDVLLIDVADDREAGPLADITDAVPGMALDLGHGAELEVVQLGPAGTIIRITYGQAAILLMENVISSTGGSVPSSEATAVVLLGDGRRVARALAGRWPGRGPLVVVAAPLPGEPFVPPGKTPEKARSILATPFDGWVRLSTDGVRFEVRAERQR